MINVSAMPDRAAIWARSWRAPNEQLSPIESGLAWRTEAQKLSIEWPERVRPDRSVIVIESMIGSSGSTRRAAWIAALAFNVSNRSEERRVGKEWRSRWSPYH